MSQFVTGAHQPVTDSDQPVSGNHSYISVLGARANNLRDVTLHIPKGPLTVFTGVSGSGKSSVVFEGMPHQLLCAKDSFTGEHLRRYVG